MLVVVVVVVVAAAAAAVVVVVVTCGRGADDVDAGRLVRGALADWRQSLGRRVWRRGAPET
eukprot:2352208-Rhodomonas_salina.1